MKHGAHLLRSIPLALLAACLLVPAHPVQAARATGLNVMAGGPYWVAVGEPQRLEPMVRFMGVDPDPLADDLRQIGLALVNFHDAYGAFPPGYVVDASGTPLYSWRVLILPFLGQQDLYDQFDLTKAWNDPVNMPLVHQMPDVYRRPGDLKIMTMTGYVAASGPGSVLGGPQDIAQGYPDPADPRRVFTSSIHLSDIIDGTSNTILVGEAGPKVRVPWTAPMDVDASLFRPVGDPAGFASRVPGYGSFLFGDGSVRFLEDAIDPTDVAHMATFAGGDVIGADLDLLSLETHYAWDLGNKGPVTLPGQFTFETPGSHPIFSPGTLPLGTDLTIALQVTSLDGSVATFDTAMVHIVTKPVADLYALMRQIPALGLIYSNSHSLQVPLREATSLLKRMSDDASIQQAIADIQTFQGLVQGFGGSGLLTPDQVAQMTGGAQAIIDEIPVP